MKSSMLSAAAFWLGFISLAAGQAAPKIQFHRTTRLVEVPVSVWRRSHFWSHGHFVRKLKRRDFELWIQGRRVPIVAVEMVRGDRAISPPPALPAGEYSNLQDGSSRNHVVYLFDFMHTAPADWMRLRQQLSRTLRRPLPANEMAAIMTLRPGLITDLPFTHDHLLLQAALRNLSSGLAGITSFAGPPPDKSSFSNPHGQSAGPNPGGALTAAMFGIASFAANPQMDMLEQMNDVSSFIQYHQSMDALRQLAALLRGIPGHKSVLWFTSDTTAAFMYNPNNALTGRAMRRAIQALNAVDVSLFPIDPAGLRVLGARSGPILNFNFNQAGASNLARATGGQAYANNNGLAQLARRAAEHYRWSYVLYFHPPARPLIRAMGTRSAPEYQNLRVKVLVPGVQVQYRHGFELRPRSGHLFQHQGMALRDIVYSPMNWSQIPLTARLGKLSPPIQVPRQFSKNLRREISFSQPAPLRHGRRGPPLNVRELRYTVTIPAARLLHFRPRQGWVYHFAIESLTISTRTGAILNLPADHVFQRLVPAQARGLQTGNLIFRGVFVLLPKFPALGRILIRDDVNGHLGSLAVPLPIITNPH